MQGHRVYVSPALRRPVALRPGDYTRTADGDWLAVLPDGTFGRMTDHTITVHDDGTISAVQPVSYAGAWRGWLVGGVWSEVV